MASLALFQIRIRSLPVPGPRLLAETRNPNDPAPLTVPVPSYQAVPPETTSQSRLVLWKLRRSALKLSTSVPLGIILCGAYLALNRKVALPVSDGLFGT